MVMPGPCGGAGGERRRRGNGVADHGQWVSVPGMGDHRQQRALRVCFPPGLVPFLPAVLLGRRRAGWTAWVTPSHQTAPIGTESTPVRMPGDTPRWRRGPSPHGRAAPACARVVTMPYPTKQVYLIKKSSDGVPPSGRPRRAYSKLAPSGSAPPSEDPMIWRSIETGGGRASSRARRLSSSSPRGTSARRRSPRLHRMSWPPSANAWKPSISSPASATAGCRDR